MLMARAAVAQPFGGAVLRGRPVAYCLTVIALCALAGCKRIDTPPDVEHADPLNDRETSVTEDHEPQPRRETPRIPRHIDLDDLNGITRDIAESAWIMRRSWFAAENESSEAVINDIDVVGIDRTRDTLVPGETVYVAEVRVQTDWYAMDADVIEVLRPYKRPDAPDYVEPVLRPLIVLDGGYHHAGVSWKVVDLGVAQSRHALLFEDHSTIDGVAATRTQVFLYDSTSEEMRLVFDEMTRWEHDPRGGPVWDADLELHTGSRALKDIVISGRVKQWRGEPDPDDMDWSDPERVLLDEERRWVFHWDRERYEGDMDIPEGED